MSDDEERSRNENQPPKDKEEKKKTLVDATHLLKAKALKQYAEKHLSEQSGARDREGGSRPSTGVGSRPSTSGVEPGTGRLKSAEGERDTISDSVTVDERPEGQGLAENGHSSQVKPNTTGGRLDENQANINNSKPEIGDHGDGLVEGEAKDSGPKGEETNVVHASESVEREGSGKSAKGVVRGDQEGGGPAQNSESFEGDDKSVSLKERTTSGSAKGIESSVRKASSEENIAVDKASGEEDKGLDNQRPDLSRSNSTSDKRSDDTADGKIISEAVGGSKVRQRMDGDSDGQVVAGEREKNQNIQDVAEKDSKVLENKTDGSVTDCQKSSEKVSGDAMEGIKQPPETKQEEEGSPGGEFESQAITENKQDSSSQEITRGNIEQSADMDGSTVTSKTTGAAAVQEGPVGVDDTEQKEGADTGIPRSTDKAEDGDASVGAEDVTPKNDIKDDDGKETIKKEGKRKRGKSRKTMRAGDERNKKEQAESDIEAEEGSDGGETSEEATDSKSEIINGEIATAKNESGANEPTESTSSIHVQGDRGRHSISGESLVTTESVEDLTDEIESSEKVEVKKRAKKMKGRSVDVIEGLDLSEDPANQSTGVKLKKSRKQDSPKPEQKPEEEEEITEEEDANDEPEAEMKDEVENVAEVVDQEEVDHGGENIEVELSDHKMAANFYYDHDDLVSKPYTTEGIPHDMFNLYHSFGFECTKRSNLHMLDNDHLIFAAGNIAQIIDIKTNKHIYIRSVAGGGIGAVAVHPSRRYFAIAEKGIKPHIVIYEYPSLRVYRILRDGTERAYANLDFSPNGDKLASVGSAPDFMLTVWDWIHENIVLRSKAFSQDVFKVAFSPEDEGHLCTSGTGHIRFWTMALTFTGLKLQGELGRFGTTQLTDIAGFVELPDGKVLSGSEWGNMLLWDGGLIKVEVSRKGKKTCHQGMIEQFFLDEGELITIGVDGFVKVWDFESIDTAEAVDEAKIFEMEPMSELKVGNDVKLISMVKSVNQDHSSIWYAQDGNGGIWKLDLSFSHTSQAPKKLFSYHAGAITGLAVSPMTHLTATTGTDQTVRLYDYLAKTPLCRSKFTAAGTSIIWMPKNVDPDGLSVLAGFADGVIRHLTVVKGSQSTVKSKKTGSAFELKLTQVFKPHVKDVTSLAVSKDGKFLATGSEDSTVFFFSVDKKYKPIGFIETGAPVVSLDWSTIQKKNNLLICCKDGLVLEVSCPKPEDHDTSKTYLLPLTGLKRTEFKFKSIKDKLVKIEEEIRKAKEEEEKRKQLEEEKRKRKERGIEEEDEENEEEQGENEVEEKVEEEEEEIYHEPGEVVEGFYHKGDNKTSNFWLLLDGWDAGYIYECEFPSSKDDVEREPLKAVKFDVDEDSDYVVVRSHTFSKNGEYLALGLDNGAVRVQALESHDMDKMASYWCLSMHDNDMGAIMNISLSFDEKFMLSVGNDGNFFVYSFMDEEKLKKIMSRDKAQIAKQVDSSMLARIDDIEDPNHYSIELEKQKAEYDRMVKLAEEKKRAIRQQIGLYRIEFKRLVGRNQEMPPYLQLPSTIRVRLTAHQQFHQTVLVDDCPKDGSEELLTMMHCEFIIDPNMKKDIETETKKKMELVEREMAWESEKKSLALRKLEMRFKDMIECDRFTLHSFKTQHSITSYRATALPPEFHEAMEENKNRMKTAEAEVPVPPAARWSMLNKKVFASKEEEDLAEEDATAEAPQTKKMKGGLDGKIAKAIEKAEQKKKKRAARQAEWDELHRSKPDLNYEDPMDLAAIKEAQENMGDFKLKSAKDYIVPEKERVNADKKRGQLMELKEQIHLLKQNFNEKMLNLRSKKLFVISEVKSLLEQLENVQNGLPLSMHVALPPLPTMQPDEQPEKIFEYTTETLKAFKKELEDGNQVTNTGGNATGFGGGFGGFGGGEQQGQQTATKMTSQLASTRTGTEQRGRSTSILSTLSSHPQSATSTVIDRGTPETISEETIIDEQPSDIELKAKNEERIRLTYRRDMLLRNIRELLTTFDAELRTLRHEKIHLDVDLKNADLRMITLFEELVLLKEFEKRENILMEKVAQKKQEKEEMQEKVQDCKMKLQAKREEMDKLQEREKSLASTLSSTIGDNNKFEAFLGRVFKKRIKRVKKTENDAESDEESDDDFSDDDYDSEEDEDSDAEELDDSVCPPGCDQAIFDQVCQLREKRLDLEEATAEEKKVADTLKKELDALTKKAKVIDGALMTAEADLEAFQREKQQKLNEFDIVVTLKLSQLQYMNNSTIPQDLSQCLVFTSSSLDGLQRRIKELEKEKAEQKKMYRNRRQQHVQLIRDKKSMEKRIVELEEKVKQMQLLKFGRLVDLEKLENLTVNKVAEELKEQLRSQEFANAKEIAGWEKRIDDAKTRLTQVTRENTRRLDTFTVLLEEKKRLERQLDSRQKNLGGEFQGNRQADFQERQRLIQLVQLQSQEIDALKEEIGLLSRKGGHILPPSQAPIPPAPSTTL